MSGGLNRPPHVMLRRRVSPSGRAGKLRAMDAVSFACSYAFAFAQLGRAVQLISAAWRKSKVSNTSGSCIEVAELTDGAIAVRNSRPPAGPALIYTQAGIRAFLTGLKNGDFDDLYPHPGGSVALFSVSH